jgi:hypothetical protein
MKIEEQIEDLLQQEINILRLLLTNLKNEQNLLIQKNGEGVNQILDERLNYLERFEGLALKLIENTLHLCLLPELIGEEEFTHPMALKLLKETIPVENMEVHSLLEQLEALFHEIENQCNITKYFLQTRGGGELRGLEPPARLSPMKQKLKKVQLELLDPEQAEET